MKAFVQFALLPHFPSLPPFQDAALLTRQRLQMPPVLPARTRSDVLLEKEPRLASIVPAGQSFVFTDVSINDDITDRTRMMVARRADGSLYSVNWEDRDRLQKIFFPLPGQRIRVPRMFEPAHLKGMLAKGQARYILDRACVQFEPDDPLFISTRSAVFDHVLAQGPLDDLFATRHLGPLALHAVLTQRYQPLMLFLRDRSPKAAFGLLCLLRELAGAGWEAVAGSPEAGQVLQGVSCELDAEWTAEERKAVLNATRVSSGQLGVLFRASVTSPALLLSAPGRCGTQTRHQHRPAPRKPSTRAVGVGQTSGEASGSHSDRIKHHFELDCRSSLRRACTDNAFQSRSVPFSTQS